MNKKVIEIYTCEKCGYGFYNAEDAKHCESKPITQDRGIKVGDLVRVLTGDGKGELVEVTKKEIIDPTWGHYNATRYHHTVGLEVKYINSWGTRFLTFDDYEKA